MKNALLFLTFFISYFCFSQNNNYVSLQGNQFKLNNNDFYPLGVNYIVQIVRNSQGDYFIAPEHAYGGTVGFDITDNSGVLNETDCFNQIVSDFNHIKNMGFNSIRLIGLSYGIGKGTDSPNYPSFISFNSNFEKTYTQITPPYSNMFQFIQSALDAAEIADLKVQLLVGGKEMEKIEYRDYFTSYLVDIASFFSSNSTLYSYDFLNEPGYFHREIISKAAVCSLVEEWFDAIHQNSNFHLTTIGSTGPAATFLWDPGILKLDFLSFHIYPKTSENESDTQGKAIDRVKSEIKWISENVELPWFIGEIGYAASPDPTKIDMGTYEDQRFFFEETLSYVRDCGGSGYQVWFYQDTPSWGDEDGMGLMDLDDNYKPAVSEIQGFSPFINQNSCSTPPNYFNYYNYDNYSVYGYVRDQNNIPIKNAIIYGWGTADDDIFHTLSDANGSFVLKYNTDIQAVRITALGSSIKEYWNVNNNDFINANLTQYQALDNLVLINEVITEQEDYTSGDYITVYNTIMLSNSSCTMHATNKIDLKTGFHAKYNSNFHGYTAPVYADCNLVSYFIKSTLIPQETPLLYKVDNNMISSKNRSIVSSENSIITSVIYPNPNRGVFNIKSSDSSIIKRIEVFNNLGEIVYEQYCNSRKIIIDLTNYPKGVYQVKSFFEDSDHSNILIIN